MTPAPLANPRTSPRTYSEWSACLDVLEAGLDDAATIAVMRQGTLDWTGGVAEMFSRRIAGTLDVKLQRCADQMARQLGAGGDEVTIVRAMTNTRTILRNLHEMATLPVFPAVLSEHLSSELQRYAQRTQQSLEDSAKSDRTGRLSGLIRNNSLLHFAAAPAAPAGSPAVSPAPAAAAPGGIRRRNILL